MNILYEGGIYYFAPWGGIQRYHVCLANHLSSDCRPTLVLPQNRLAMVSRPNCPCIELNTDFAIKPLRRPWRVLRRWQIAKFWDRFDADLEHWTYYTGLCERRVCRRDRPLVITVHDFIHETFPNEDPTGKHRRWKHDAIEAADHIICVSEFTLAGLAHHYPAAVSKASVVWHGNALRDVTASSIPATLCGRKFVLYVGRRDGYKNFATLLSAWSKISRETNAALVVVGSPWSRRERESFVKSYPTNELILLPHANDAMVRGLYEACICFVFPTRMEGFGLPALEAMECGAPVLLSDCEAMHEVAGNAGHYFDPDDTETLAEMIVQASHDNLPQQTDRIAIGKSRAIQFSWHRAATETEAVYRKLLGHAATQSSVAKSLVRVA